MIPAQRVAFVDESNRHLSEGRYGTLLAAVVIDEAGEATATRLARTRLSPGQLRFHWRDESRRTRRDFIEAVTSQHDIDLSIVVVSTTVERARRIESGRVQTLWRLLAELERLDVGRLVIESRLERNDRRDRREIERAKQAGVCRRGLVYAHHRPTEGPPLWIADAVAGSASAHVFDHDGGYWAMWTSAGDHISVSHIEHPAP